MWWSLSLTALLGALLGVMYLGLVPSAQATVEWLATHPAAREAFRDPTTGARDALMALLAFAMLAPLATALVLSALVSAVCSAASRLEPAVSRLALPTWVPLLVLGVLGAGLGLAAREIWLPKCMEVLALAARAYLVWIASA